jgi:CubicO group peptidase (beta-lactamase class C family)
LDGRFDEPAPTARNYGYIWSLNGNGRFAASGIFGQYIYVDPERRVVIVTHSLWPLAYNRELPAHQRAFPRCARASRRRDARRR